jgi:hypothetical protein
MKYICPVCGFDAMPFPPEDNNICSCCGTEFGYHDLRLTHAELRQQWRDRGAPWFSTRLLPPVGWNPTKQLNGHLLRGTEILSSVPVFPMSPTRNVAFRLPRRKKRITTAPHQNDLLGAMPLCSSVL